MSPKITNSDLAVMLQELKNDILQVKNETKTCNLRLLQMEKTIKKQNETIQSLTDQLKLQILKSNDQEQHNRQECLRIRGMSLDPDRKQDNIYVKRKVYEDVLKPLLTLSVENEEDDLSEVSPLDMLLKTAHILPKPKGSKHNGEFVICRLNLMDIRNRIFRYRKQFYALKADQPKIMENLTSMNIRVLSRLYESQSVDSCWSMQGALFYTMKSDLTTPKKKHRVKNPFRWLTNKDLRELRINLPEMNQPDDRFENEDDGGNEEENDADDDDD